MDAKTCKIEYNKEQEKGEKTLKPETMTKDEYIEKLEDVINTLQTKNDVLESLAKIMDFTVKNDFISAKEQNLVLMRKLQELDKIDN